MKKRKLFILSISLFVLAIIISFKVGQKVEYNRQMNIIYTQNVISCVQELSKPLVWIEESNNDISDPATLNLITGSIYVVQNGCMVLSVRAEASKLWNDLLYRSEKYIGNEELLIDEICSLQDALNETIGRNK